LKPDGLDYLNENHITLEFTRILWSWWFNVA